MLGPQREAWLPSCPGELSLAMSPTRRALPLPKGARCLPAGPALSVHSRGWHPRGAGFSRASPRAWHRTGFCSRSPAALGLSLSAFSDENGFCTASVATSYERSATRRPDPGKHRAVRLLQGPALSKRALSPWTAGNSSRCVPRSEHLRVLSRL